MATKKNEYCNPNRFNISYFRNPFHFFWFHIYAIDNFNFCFHHFITLFSNLNQPTMGAKVEFVYNVLCLFYFIFLVVIVVVGNRSIHAKNMGWERTRIWKFAIDFTTWKQIVILYMWTLWCQFPSLWRFTLVSHLSYAYSTLPKMNENKLSTLIQHKLGCQGILNDRSKMNEFDFL